MTGGCLAFLHEENERGSERGGHIESHGDPGLQVTVGVIKSLDLPDGRKEGGTVPNGCCAATEA